MICVGAQATDLAPEPEPDMRGKSAKEHKKREKRKKARDGT